MSSHQKPDGEKLIGTNPTAHQNYFISEMIEAGILLGGTEVKSLRTSAPNLRDSFVEVTHKMEAWLVNAHIAPYTHGNIWNHEPLRKRKLLMHRHQIEQLHSSIQRDGMTVVPIRMYFKKGRAKIELGLGKGKKRHDKRETLKKKSVEREMDQAKKRRL